MKQSTELQDFSIKMGLLYEKSIDNLPRSILDKDFLLFSSFHIHKQKVLPACFSNILSGKLDHFEIFLSDFRSDYSIDENAFCYKQTIFILRSAGFSFRKFYLIPKNTERFTVRLEHIGQDFFLPIIKGYKKIPFSKSPRLNTKYVLKTQEEHPSQVLLSMQFMQYLENHSRWFIEGCGDSLLVYRRGEEIDVSDVHEYISNVTEIGRLLLQFRGQHA